MGRVLKILAYAVILFLLYLVVTGFLKSCKNKSDIAASNIENTAENQEDYDIFEDADNEDGSEVDGDSSADLTEETETIDYTKIDAALEEKSSDNKPALKEKTTSNSKHPVTKNRTTASGSGDYFVIAGSYIVNSNAENMVLKLKKMGYQNAEIVVFDYSQYHTVVASRSTTYDGAYGSVSELKNKGIDSYVHKKS